MKRYWLFAFNTYYPYGGFQDFEGSYDTTLECHNYFNSLKDKTKYQIFDSVQNKIVFDTQKMNIDIYDKEPFFESVYSEKLKEIYAEEFLNQDK